MNFKYEYISFFIIIPYILLNSCSNSEDNKLVEPTSINKEINNSINLIKLTSLLSEADQNLTPKLISDKDGSSYYSYIKKPGEGDLSIKEIEKRVSLGSDFYINEREKIKLILDKINKLKINNTLSNIDNGALGLWIPSRNQLIIDFKVIKMGSPTFLDILRHEAIHIAQSCFNGSKNSYPKRIGLPLEFSKNINLNLTHQVYSNNPEELMYLEREAFTYSKVDRAAEKLLNKFCF